MSSRDGSKFMLFLLLYVIGLQLFAVPIILGLMGYEGIPASWLTPQGRIVQLFVMLMLPLGLWAFVNREKFSGFMPSKRLDFTNVVLIVVLSFTLQPIMMLISGITTLFTPNEVGEMMVEMIDYPLWLLVLSMAVSPALFEEIVFRGYIQSKYQAAKVYKVVLINGLFFAIMHLNLHQFTYVFAMGVIFSLLVYYTKNLWAGVLAHFIMNASQVVILRFIVWFESIADESAGLENAEAVNTTPAMIIFLAFIVIGALILSIVLLRIFIRHNRVNIEKMPVETQMIRSKFDPYSIAIVGIFVIFMGFMHFISPRL